MRITGKLITIGRKLTRRLFSGDGLMSLGNIQKDGQAALNLDHRIGIDASERRLHFVTFHGHGFVHHHL